MVVNGKRELAYVVKVDDIIPIEGADNVEIAKISGWTCIVHKNVFKPGDYGVYFETDAKVPATEPFLFLANKNFKIKIQKYFKGKVISNGLLMSFDEFTVNSIAPSWVISLKNRIAQGKDVEHECLTEILGVTYADDTDNVRKSSVLPRQLYFKNQKTYNKPLVKWMLKCKWGKEIMFALFGNKRKDNSRKWPTGRFPGVSKTDCERIENMPYLLQDKTPYIATQKCDGSSATYILERKKMNKNKFEFYVCSRNVRLLNPKQDCYYDRNFYWEIAEKYKIYSKMEHWMRHNPQASFVCWQGEICGPGIQKNPHHLFEIHLFCFHWTDSINGRLPIDEAENMWKIYNMETVPIMGTVVLPDTMEELKKEADGYYDPSCCEGLTHCRREGIVYYKTTDPNFYFKNVSNDYLLRRK